MSLYTALTQVLAPYAAKLNGLLTGWDGTKYTTPGEAVRRQVSDLHVLIGDVPGTAIASSAVSYDGTSSDLSATNVQAAVDETNEKVAAVNGRLTESESALNTSLDADSFEWAIGTLDPGNGFESVSNAQVRSEYIPVTEGTVIKYAGSANCLIVYCFDTEKTYMSDSTWADGNTFTVGAGAGFARILLRKSNNAEVGESEIPTLVADCHIVVALPKDLYLVPRAIEEIQNAKNTVYSRNIDTDIIPMAVFERGGYATINSYANPRPNTNRIRIRHEFTLNAKKVHIVANDGFGFAYCIFNSNNTMIPLPSKYAVATNTDITVENNDIAMLRLVVAKTDNSAILPNEAVNISVIVDDKPISFSDFYNLIYTEKDNVLDALDAVNEHVSAIDEYLFGVVYTDKSIWVDGGWGAIVDYDNPNPTINTIRIRSEFVTNDGKPLTINRNVDGYDFVYACFDSEGTLIEGRRAWQSASIELPYTNIHTVRISIRKSDNSTITIDEYQDSGITISSKKETQLEFDAPVKLKVMTYNIGRFSYGVSPYYLVNAYAEKLANYKKFFATQKCDIIGLQEQNTYLDGATSGEVAANNAIFDYLYPYHSDVSNWTCIKSKYELSDVGTHYFETTSNRRSYSYATLNIYGKSIFLLCVHTTPNAGNEQDALRAQEVAEIITLVSDKDYFIVFGDFNAQTTALFDAFTAEGYHIANGGYLPFEWTYSYDSSDFSADTPSASIRYFDNIITSANIIVDDSERLNVYSDLSSDHIPFVAYLTVN